MNDPDHLLTYDDVSRILQVPVNTLRQWRHRGEGPPALRIGGHVRFRRADVDAWIESRVDAARSA